MRLIALIRTSLIGGVLVAGLFFPVTALAGIGAKEGADLVSSLPANLELKQPAQTTYVYANDGKTLITAFFEENRKLIPSSAPCRNTCSYAATLSALSASSTSPHEFDTSCA